MDNNKTSKEITAFVDAGMIDHAIITQTKAGWTLSFALINEEVITNCQTGDRSKLVHFVDITGAINRIVKYGVTEFRGNLEGFDRNLTGLKKPRKRGNNNKEEPAPEPEKPAPRAAKPPAEKK